MYRAETLKGILKHSLKPLTFHCLQLDFTIELYFCIATLLIKHNVEFLKCHLILQKNTELILLNRLT